MTRDPHVSVLVGPPGAGAPSDTLTDEVTGLSWSHGQHGPASLVASSCIPGITWLWMSEVTPMEALSAS